MPIEQGAAIEGAAARRRTLIAIAVVVLAVLLAFATNLGGAFVWDDKGYLFDNPRLARGAGFWTAVKTPLDGQVFRPVSTATLWLEVQLHGFSMAAFRVVQLSLHLGVGFSLFVWLRRRLASFAGALVGAAIFLVHPAVTEGVMFANARHDVLGALFALLALLSIDDGRSLRRGVLAGACVLLAIGCKESYVVLAPLSALQVYASPTRERLGARLALALIPSSVAVAVALGLRKVVAVSTASGLSLGVWPLARAYAALLVHHLAAFLTFTDAPTAERYVPPSSTITALVLLIAAATSVALAWSARRGAAIARVAFLGGAIVLLGLLPSIAAIPATGQYGNRYGYFPLVGFAMVLAAAAVPVVVWIEGRTTLLRRLAAVTAGASLLVLTGETWARASDWRDGLSLFGADVARIPDDSRANYHYGVEVVATRGCEDALPFFARAADEEPGWARPLRNVAGCLLRLGRPLEALEPARRAVALEPLEAAHHRNLAAALLATGHVDEARAELDEAERLAPGAPQNAALRQSFP